MGIREDVKSGKISSKDAFSSLEMGLSRDPPSTFTPEIEAWLRRRINRSADAQEEAVRVKAAEKAKSKESPKKKKRKKKSWNYTPTRS